MHASLRAAARALCADSCTACHYLGLAGSLKRPHWRELGLGLVRCDTWAGLAPLAPRWGEGDVFTCRP